MVSILRVILLPFFRKEKNPSIAARCRQYVLLPNLTSYGGILEKQRYIFFSKNAAINENLLIQLLTG